MVDAPKAVSVLPEGSKKFFVTIGNYGDANEVTKVSRMLKEKVISELTEGSYDAEARNSAALLLNGQLVETRTLFNL